MAQPGTTLIIGAGQPVSDLIRLIKKQNEYVCQGILDPDASLKGTFIDDIPVLGWLGDIPRHATTAVMGCPHKPNGFDRKSVYHILSRHGLSLPILPDTSTSIAPDVILPSGSILLNNSIIEAGVSLGINCLLESNSKVTRDSRLPEHTVVGKGKTWRRTETPSESDKQLTQLNAILATENESLKKIIKRINWANMEIILVVNDQGVLIGTITDGDIRRGLLAGIDLEHPASIIMNKHPETAPQWMSRENMLRVMREKSIRHLPVIDENGHPVFLERMENIIDEIGHDAIVIAGGLGTRLRPLTDSLPKPLLPVGNRPILDHILSGLKNAGIDDVVLSVNYRGDQIREHVGSGKRHDLSVNYITEKQRLGTAGALSLLSPRPQRPFLVMNGDLLTNLNYSKLLHFQRENDYALVMCVRQYKIQVPYGVVSIDQEGHINGLQEKPVHEHFINAGIYVLKPQCIDLIPKAQFFDMTDLTNALIEKGETIAAFPLVEYWRDIGRPEDLRAATDHLNQQENPMINQTIPMEAVR